MRLVSFEIPYSGGVGELSIIQLGGEGGGLEANVNRWRGQIGLGPLSRFENEAEAENGVSEIGNYQFFRLITLATQESAFLAAIFPLASSALFIKLIATADGLLDLEKDFKAVCYSLKGDNRNQ